MMQDTPGILFSRSTMYFRRLSNSAFITGREVLGPAERLERGLLRDGRGVRRALALDVGHGRDDVLGAGREADAPAGHGVGLGHAVHHDG